MSEEKKRLTKRKVCIKQRTNKGINVIESTENYKGAILTIKRKTLMNGIPRVTLQ